MKRLLFAFTVIVALSGGLLHAQDVVGIWQGTLQTQGRELRVQIRVANDGGLKATFHSIDQGPGAIPGTVTLQGSSMKIAIPGIGGSYEGRLTADGSAAEGTWTQIGGPAIKLDLKKVTVEAAWPLPAAPPRLAAMPANWVPAFEVATIKPSRPDTPGQSITIRGRTFGTLNQTV